MDDHGHVAKLREVYRLYRLSKGANSHAWLDLFGDALSFRSIGAGTASLEFAKNGASRADVERYFRLLLRDWEMLDMVMEDFICDGDRVSVLGSCSWRNRRTGKTAHSLKADFFRFEGGQVVEYTELYDTAAAVAAAS